MSQDPAHSPARPGLAALVALLWLVGALWGCEPSGRSLRAEPLPAPRGGALLTVARVEGGESAQLVAPTARGVLFVRDAEQGRWRGVTPLDDQGEPLPLRGLERAPSSFTFPRSRLFTAHGDRLWMITREAISQSPQLWFSQDQGGRWARGPMPAAYERGWHLTERPRQELRISQAPISVSADLRLLPHGDELYLMDASHIWRLQGREWAEVSLEGVALEPQAARDNFPPALRNYLPADAGRGFELLTVLGAQLMVYRRSEGTSRWVLTATLATVDRQVLSSADGRSLFLLTPDSIYSADASAEQWTRVRLIDGVGAEECEVMLRLESSEQDRATLLVGTSSGSIVRSEDGGATWSRARPPEPDARGISALTRGQGGSLWAMTRGAGALRSTDGGASWAPDNAGLRATIPYAITTRPGGQLVVGTDGGAFLEAALDASDEEPWRALHTQSASALLSPAGRADVLMSGSLGGAVVTSRIGASSDEPPRPEGMAPRGPQGVLYRPPGKRGLPLRPTALLSLQQRPQTPMIFALSHRRGALVSLDEGASWLEESPTPSLLEALKGSHVTEALFGARGRRYLLSRPLRERQGRAQLWRSDDDGETWRTVHTFDEELSRADLRLMRLREGDPDGLLVMSPRQLARSRDGGRSWSELEGDWQEQSLLAIGRKGERAGMLTQTRRGLEYFETQEIGAEAPGWTRHTISTPPGAPLQDVRELELGRGELFVRTQDGLWRATPSDRPTELTYNLTLLLAFALTLGMGGAAFALIKRLR